MTRVIDSPVFWWALMVGAPAYIWLIGVYIVLRRNQRVLDALGEMQGASAVLSLLEAPPAEGPAGVPDLAGRVVALDSRRKTDGAA